ncbi:MAG: hypothetical protein Q7S28_00240 [bacterium]|nr:hypothetical protein [bacterium]
MTSAQFFSTYGPVLKILSIVLTAFFLAASFDRAMKILNLSGALKGAKALLNKPAPQRVAGAWKQVLMHVTAGDLKSMKLALFEADAILNEALRLGGYPGATLGERLKIVDASQISNLEAIWAAHKLRNRLAHEPSLELTTEDIRTALRAFQAALRELRLID